MKNSIKGQTYTQFSVKNFRYISTLVEEIYTYLFRKICDTTMADKMSMSMSLSTSVWLSLPVSMDTDTDRDPYVDMVMAMGMMHTIHIFITFDIISIHHYLPIVIMSLYTFQCFVPFSVYYFHPFVLSSIFAIRRLVLLMFFTIRRFRSTFCPIWRFFHQRFLSLAFSTSTFCQWISVSHVEVSLTLQCQAC
jgi:hypothetical protein